MKLIPAEVTGYFRRHRDWTQFVLLLIFLGLPWIKIGGHQSILLNIPERKFAIFGLVFRAHEVPLLFFLVAIGLLSLAFVTAVWGRVWCGWACPQTVFVDAVYRRIEIWVEGRYIERRRLETAPWDFSKITKKTTKWILFFAVSSLIAHCFMAYFTGSSNLIQMMRGSPEENWTYFLIVSFFTAVILFDFAWFREQFCIYACPYGRFQSVLLDPSSLVVAYDEKRGEPRKAKGMAKPAGDCVSCNRCVEVCPTGIDIRDGLQMECINCTACIDACNAIMTKVNKPKDLIGYRTLNNEPWTFRKIKPIFFLALLVISICGLALVLSQRQAADVAVLRGKGLPFTLSRDAAGNEVVLNQFRLHISDHTGLRDEYEMKLPEVWQELNLKVVSAMSSITIPASGSGTWSFFVEIPKAAFASSVPLKVPIFLKSLSRPQDPLIESELTLMGPAH